MTSPAAAQQKAAYEIIQRKGATNHAIGLVTAALLKAVLRGENRALTVSRVQDGALGLKDLALSLPAIVGTGGAAHVVESELSREERNGLERSATVLRQAIVVRALVRTSCGLIRPASKFSPARGDVGTAFTRRPA
jgi:L-lactate dehydrogenase